MSKAQKNKIRFIQPRNVLKEKVGSGGIDPKKIEEAQSKIDTPQFDFRPLAREMLDSFKSSIEKERSKPITDNKHDNAEGLNDIAVMIMQIKGTGAMFKYPLLSQIGDSALTFLEDLEILNGDVYKILDAHHKALSLVVAQNIHGSNAREIGNTLLQELHDLKQRYDKKYSE